MGRKGREGPRVSQGRVLPEMEVKDAVVIEAVGLLAWLLVSYR